MPAAFRQDQTLSIPRRGIGYAGLMSTTNVRIIVRLTAVLAALFTALFVAPCGKSDEHADHGPSTDEPMITGEPAAFNADDIAFATNMIPHHQQAVDLALLVPERSDNPELIALAQQIGDVQEPEIAALRVFLVQWNENPDDQHGDHSAHVEMKGMVDDATMERLKSLSGPEFDQLWLESMIAHHQGAIEMAQAELANGINDDAKNLAQQIITAQQAEIDQMRQMLGGGQGG